MSANPRPPARSLAGHTLRPMTLSSLDGVVALETEVYPFPWTRGNFVDSLAAGYIAWTLNGVGGELLAYCVAMRGAGEMHLLNITVAPAARRQGHARRLLDALAEECRKLDAERLWLEVRVANVDAQRTYLRLGFTKVGVRKGYYPAPAGSREDAVVMSKIVGRAAGGSDALE
jgi:[ribosomal protein S18]-alanine N-acetyltransferase